MSRRHSRGEAEMDAHLEALNPASERHKTLLAARAFKAAWVELGEALTAVREASAFKAWGYSTFEAYCRRELRIKQETANKLTRSYAFLRDHEPDVLQGREGRELPALDVVDLLSQARERTTVSDDQLVSLREEVFSTEAAPPTRTAVMKRLREQDPEAFKPAEKPVAAPGENDMRKALLLAERLETLLVAQGDGIGPDALRNARHVVRALRERFAEGRRAGAA